MEIHEASEMYLETILILKNRLGLVKSVDIAREMDYSKPTISIAMKKFKENGYITIDEEGFISMTDKGREIAERIYERHQVLSHLLEEMGVSEKNAVADACKMEHDLSDETFECLKKQYMRLKKKK